MTSLAKLAAVLAASAFAIIGCSQQGTEGAKLAAGQKLQITQKVWTEYQEYLVQGRGLGPDRHGAFGVAIIGNLGVAGLYNYYYCPRQYDACRPGKTAVSDVLDACRTENVECVIFARNEDIQVPYEIVE